MTEDQRSAEIALVEVGCTVCESEDAKLIASGHDYEYWTSPSPFHAHRCLECGNVFLNPRPDVSEFERIYPSEYHSLEFSRESFRLVHEIRSRLEAKRLLAYCAGIPADARVLDVGCGDGFHLGLLQENAPTGWTLEGVDLDRRAAEMARRKGLVVHVGTVEDLARNAEKYDVVYTLQTIEHVADPHEFMVGIHSVLKPGGRLVVVTDNTDSVDFGLFKTKYWGGYHFPRHWNLFNRRCLARLARRSGFEVDHITTIVSPVNWVYSLHNLLVGWGAPAWVINRFTLKSPVSLGVFTIVDTILQLTGRGALLNGYFTKPVRQP
jgi:2-polyprenyl-3-methyl-5-hydroxy-6-metoxy-1,4-benzoquinol methylase